MLSRAIETSYRPANDSATGTSCETDRLTDRLFEKSTHTAFLCPRRGRNRTAQSQWRGWENDQVVLPERKPSKRQSQPRLAWPDCATSHLQRRDHQRLSWFVAGASAMQKTLPISTVVATLLLGAVLKGNIKEADLTRHASRASTRLAASQTHPAPARAHPPGGRRALGVGCVYLDDKEMWYYDFARSDGGLASGFSRPCPSGWTIKIRRHPGASEHWTKANGVTRPVAREWMRLRCVLFADIPRCRLWVGVFLSTERRAFSASAHCPRLVCGAGVVFRDTFAEKHKCNLCIFLSMNQAPEWDSSAALLDLAKLVHYFFTDIFNVIIR